MKNPFTLIPDAQQAAIIDRWLAAQIFEDESNGWDLVESDDEWGIYTVGEVKKLGQIAGLSIEFTGIDLPTLLSSTVVTDLFDETWIRKIQTLDDVYMDLVLDYLEHRGWKPEAYIQITKNSGA